jgi:hypothetical protein
MNLHVNRAPIQHRSSLCLNWTALSAKDSSVGRDKFATSTPDILDKMPFFERSNSSLHLPSSSPLMTPTSTASILNYYSACSNTSGRTKRTPNGINSTASTPFIILRSTIHLAAFNVRSLKLRDQQATLAVTMDTLKVDVCCISIRVALGAQTESALLDSIPVNSRPCTVRLKSSVKVRSCRPSSETAVRTSSIRSWTNCRTSERTLTLR